MEPRRYDETEEEAGQGRVELTGEAQAHALTRLGQAMRVLGLIQAVVAVARVKNIIPNNEELIVRYNELSSKFSIL